MGYTTEFVGRFYLNESLSEAQATYLTKFRETRRVKRNPKLAETMADPVRLAVGLPIGDEAAYFVGGLGFYGQDEDPSVLDSNMPPVGQPGLWCQWVPKHRSMIEWDGSEKFYHYVTWLQYLVEHFLKPWGHVLNGEVFWIGEGREADLGKIVVKKNKVSALQGAIAWRPHRRNNGYGLAR